MNQHIRSAALIPVALVALAHLAMACGGDDDLPICPDEPAREALTAQERYIVGAGAPYETDDALRMRRRELRRSQATRREVGWEVVERGLSPVPVAQPLSSLALPQIARFRTWHDEEDLVRMARHIRLSWGTGGPQPLTEADLDEVFEWNNTAVEGMAAWPTTRLEEYLAGIDDTEKLAGVGGISLITYNDSAARHLLASHAAIVDCEDDAAVPPFVAEAPGTPHPERTETEALDLAQCGREAFGPYFLMDGDTLSAQTDTSAELWAARDDEPFMPCAADDACELTGPGGFRLQARARRATTGTLTIRWDEPDPAWAGCLNGPFPDDAVIVKSDFRRVGFGVTLPVYDTTAAGLEMQVVEDGTWPEADTLPQADPPAEDIYTVTIESGAVYRLAALHFMTKEADHWVWITLWWAPEPDDDFGADRPASMAGMGPWANYKMCVATDFLEEDDLPGGGMEDPTLRDALAAVYEGVGGPSWCSNPYLEVGPGNAITNCIGCHQHGGTQIPLEDILGDPIQFPHTGRTQIRNNFPADYTYATSAGDRLGAMFAVELYDR